MNLFGEDESSQELTWPDGTVYVQVALEVPLNQTFTYATPPTKAPPPIGAWVMVPFGGGSVKSFSLTQNPHSKSGRLLPALVVGHRNQPPLGIKRIRTWKEIVPLPPMPSDWMALLKFAADFYHYPLGLAASAAFPLALRSQVDHKKHPALQKPKVVWLTFQAQEAEVRATPNFNRKTSWHKLLMLVASTPQIHLPTTINAHPHLMNAIKDWQARAWLTPSDPTTIPEKLPQAIESHVLNEEQSCVVNRIFPETTSSGFSVHVLQGITGSGKTEVYFSLIEKVRRQHQQVLLLMPEISLTPQMHSRLLKRFPQESIVMLHSSLAGGARQKALMAAMRGEATIVVGTRLSVFAPLKSLGLIIVDEEHDASFKQSEQAFSYSARDLAVYRAKQWACPIILGSATPSLETYHYAMQGRYQLHVLTRRAVQGALPPVIECVNTKGVKLIEGFAPLSLSVIEQALSAREQVLVFLNRRGYAPALFCEACGWLAGCPACSANLILHRADQCLRCHHCAHHEPIPKACPFCGNADILMKGYGTQKLEELLRSRFPNSPLQRIDRDASGSFQAFSDQQRAIAEGQVHLIIGTQMMAKGHDFPLLTTVIILGADNVLFANDYRGAERLYSLLTQVAGRAGRHQKPGRVLVQTGFSDHPLFASLMAHDFPTFAQGQLKERLQQGVPPFAHQALLRVESSSLKIASEWMNAHRPIFSTYAPSQVMLYDAVPMKLARKAGWERMQMLIESPERPPLHAFLKSLTDYLYTLPPHHHLKWWLDVSPLEI